MHYSRQRLTEWLAKSGGKHEVELVMQQLGQMRTHCNSQHADALEYGLL